MSASGPAPSDKRKIDTDDATSKGGRVASPLEPGRKINFQRVTGGEEYAGKTTMEVGKHVPTMKPMKMSPARLPGQRLTQVAWTRPPRLVSAELTFPQSRGLSPK